MKKEVIPMFSSVKFLILLSLFFSSHNFYSQCIDANAMQEFCAINYNTIDDLTTTQGVNVVWYDALTGGNQYDSSTVLVDGSSYYGLDIDASCTDVTRFEVTVIINGEPPTNVSVFDGKCASENPTINDLSADGTAIKWYNEQSGGTSLASTIELEDGKTYWVEQTENGCTSERLPTTVSLIDPATPTVESQQSFCSSLNPTVSDLQAAESNIVWYNDETSTVPLNTSTPLINGEDYWATQTAFPCESTIRIQTTVIIETAPNAGTDGSYSECEINLVTTNLFTLLGGSPDLGGSWSGPSLLSNGDLGTFDPTINTEGTYTYTVVNVLGICTDATASVEVIIKKVLPPTISESNQSFCKIDNPKVTDLIPNDATIIWYDAETNGNIVATTDSLIDGTTYWAAQTDTTTGCESVTRKSVTATINVILPPTISESNQSFCKIDNPTIADIIPNDATVVWYDAETNGNIVASTDSLIDGTTYWAAQTDTTTGCESATRNSVTVTINVILPPTISESNQSFCEIDNPTVADLIPNDATVVWYDAETNGNIVTSTDNLVDGTTYWVGQTDTTTGCESVTRNSVTATINVILPPTISNSSQSFCEIDDPTVADLIPNDATIIWYDAENNGNVVATTDSLIDGTTYWAAQTDTTTGCESVTRNSVTATINVILPPTISESNQSFCEIDNPTVADMIPNDATIIWYDAENNGDVVATTDNIVDGATYWATQTDTTTGCESATRNSVTATITVILPPTISESNQSFCEIDNATVADLIPNDATIIWYDAETNGNIVTSTDNLVDGTTYWAAQTDTTTGCESVTRNSVTVTITVILPPTISESNQSFCEIDDPMVADLIPNDATIIWYDAETNGNIVATTDSLVNGISYWASQTDTTTGCESVTRNSVTATINVILPPTISNSSQSFCEIDDPTVADLIPNDATIIWYDAENNGNAVATTDSLIDGTTYWAAQTDTTTGCESVTRNSVTATINVILPPTISESNQSFCEIDNPTVADMIPNDVTILWYDAENNGNIVATTDNIVDGATYWAAQTDTTTGCESVTRNSVTATINVILPPTISESNQSFCEIDNTTVADLIPNDATIIWYDTETNGNIVATTDSLVDGTTYWAAQTDTTTSCESVTRNSVTVTILTDLPPTTSETTQTFCEIENATVADLQVIGNNIKWYESETATTALTETDLLINGKEYWASQSSTSNSCESVARAKVTVSIIVVLRPTTSATDQSFCMNDFAPNSPTIADLAITGTTIQWYENENSTTPLNTTDVLVDGQTYWASQTAANGCESILRTAINVSVSNPLKASTSNSAQIFCVANNSTIANLEVTGDTIIWFDTETSTTALTATDLLIDGEDYWALNTNGAGCESASRLQITVTVTDVTPPVINETTQYFCEASNPTIADLLTPDTTEWFASETATTPLNSTDLLVNNSTYWAAAVNNAGCISSVKVEVTVILDNPGTPILANLGNEFCKIDNPMLADLDDNVTANNNGSITWYSEYPNGSPLSLSAQLIDQETYYAVETDTNGCSSVNPLGVTVDLNACDEYKIITYDGFSPNGDGINDTFKIKYLRDLYPDFKVQFFNRWGNLVYTADANKEDWNGRLNGDDEYVTSGVYYFVINFNSADRKPLQDRLYLSR